MNQCAISRNGFLGSRQEMRASTTVIPLPSSISPPANNNCRKDGVVCPKPRRVSLLSGTFNDHPSRPLPRHLCSHSNQVELSDAKAESDLLDIILNKGGEAAGVERSGTGIINSNNNIKDNNNNNNNIAQLVVASSPPPFFSGSPPSRVSNPLIHDARFRQEMVFLPSTNIINNNNNNLPGSFGQLVGQASTTAVPWSPTTSSPSSARKGGCVRANFGNNPAVRVEGFDCLDRDRSRNCSIPALA